MKNINNLRLNDDFRLKIEQCVNKVSYKVDITWRNVLLAVIYLKHKPEDWFSRPTEDNSSFAVLRECLLTMSDKKLMDLFQETFLRGSMVGKEELRTNLLEFIHKKD